MSRISRTSRLHGIREMGKAVYQQLRRSDWVGITFTIMTAALMGLALSTLDWSSVFSHR